MRIKLNYTIYVCIPMYMVVLLVHSHPRRAALVDYFHHFFTNVFQHPQFTLVAIYSAYFIGVTI